MAEQKEKKQSLVVRTGERYGVDPDKLLDTLKSTAFRQKEGEVSNEQMMALLVVAEKYDLDPFTNQLYAFPAKSGGIVPVVGIDGWMQVINRHPQFDGFELTESDETVTLPGAKEAPKWMEAKIYVKDRRAPVIVREYVEEVYRSPYTNREGKTIDGPWQTHTRRMLRHKTLIQGARVAFGLSGIYDEDEAERVLEAQNQAIEAEVVAEIEDVEGKFMDTIKEHGFSTDDLPVLTRYLDETATISQMEKLDLLKNLVIGFTADPKEIDKFIESFGAWKAKNVKEDPETQKRELVAELDEMISAVEDDSKVEEVLKKYSLELGNLSSGKMEDLQRVKTEINALIDKQASMF